MKAVYTFNPNAPTYSGLLGKWTVAVFDDSGKQTATLLADYGRCCAFAKKHGVKNKDCQWADEASKREAWAEFRRRYR